MEPRRFRPRLIEVAVVLAGILVAFYAFWVIRDVGSSGPDVAQPKTPTKTISETPTPTAKPTPKTPAPIGPFRGAVAKAQSVLVVGDASGDQIGEWVDLWSRTYAENPAAPRQVTLHTWDVTGQQFVTASVRGTGRPLEVWNLSYPGTRADYAQHLAEVPQKPGAVLLSLGHDRAAKPLARAVSTTTSAVSKTWGKVPTAYVLQNPAKGPKAQQQASIIAQLRALAVTNRVPVIDVAAAFRKAGPLDALLADGALPNQAGSQLWAETVTKTLKR